MSSRREGEPLVITDQVIKEIVQEVERVFILETNRINFSFDQNGIVISVYPRHGELFVLPEGPVMVRLQDGTFRYV